jgi:hypothetical protein
MYLELDERTSLVIQNASLEGAVFRSDSMKVLSLLKSLLRLGLTQRIG